MKFKFKPERSNLFLMSSILIFSLVTCLFWLVLREYTYFIVYIILTLLIAYMYYFTVYIIKEKFLVVRLGFIPIRIKYTKIRKVEDSKEGIKISLKYFNFNIYPNNKDVFMVKLNSKFDKQKFV